MLRIGKLPALLLCFLIPLTSLGATKSKAPAANSKKRTRKTVSPKKRQGEPVIPLPAKKLRLREAPRNSHLPRPENAPTIDDGVPSVDVLYPEKLGEHVSDVVVGLANRLDSFFGDPRSDDERNGSTLRLMPSYTFYSDRHPTFEMGVNLNLKLRNLETKAKKFEQSLRSEIIETTQIDQAFPVAGRGRPQEQTNRTWLYNFESKLAARPALYYGATLRVRRSFLWGFLLNHFAVSLSWDTDDAWTQRTFLSSDRALTDTLLFRFINEANWFMTNERFETSHGPTLIQTINQYNSISYNFRIQSGLINNELHHLNSVYSLNYRHGTPSKRIFLDLIPSYSYPRSLNYKELRTFEVRLEYFFGDI